jgi:hypothetical protein
MYQSSELVEEVFAFWRKNYAPRLRETEQNATLLAEFVAKYYAGVASVVALNAAYEALKDKLDLVPEKKMTQEDVNAAAAKAAAAQLRRTLQDRLNNNNENEFFERVRKSEDFEKTRALAKVQEQYEARVRSHIETYTKNASQPGRIDWTTTMARRESLSKIRVKDPKTGKVCWKLTAARVEKTIQGYDD